MKAIVLVAGQGTRMGNLTTDTSKCLLPYENTTILGRLISQLKKYEINDIILVVGYLKEKIIEKFPDTHIVVNNQYRGDKNILSMYLAVDEIIKDGVDDVIVFEGDILVEDEFVHYVTGTDFENKSVWFTCGKFQKHQRGGILKTDGRGKVVDIKITDYKDDFKDYDKINGVMRISASVLPKFRDVLATFKEKTLNQYYHIPWTENLDIFLSEKGDAKDYLFSSFNTESEYNLATSIDYDTPLVEKYVYLAKVSDLYPIEEHDKNRIPIVKNAVIENGSWKVPLCIEKNYNLVLDGHHSLELAKQLGLCFVPVIGFDYREVNMWSLREEINISKRDVVCSALSGELFPYKTVKHKFPNVRYKCYVGMDKLGGETNVGMESERT